MRINCSDEEDFPGQWGLWEGNCGRSIRSKAGQRELREFEAALLALPEKRLIHGKLRDDEGGVCAIGAYGLHKGVDLSKFDPEYDNEEVGIAGGMPRLVAWSIVALNDMDIDDHLEFCPGPVPLTTWGALQHPPAGYYVNIPYTPEERYEKVLAWVRARLKADPAPLATTEDR